MRALRVHLEASGALGGGIGVNHAASNLRFDEADVERTMHILADEVLPAFDSER